MSQKAADRIAILFSVSILGGFAAGAACTWAFISSSEEETVCPDLIQDDRRLSESQCRESFATLLQWESSLRDEVRRLETDLTECDGIPRAGSSSFLQRRDPSIPAGLSHEEQERHWMNRAMDCTEELRIQGSIMIDIVDRGPLPLAECNVELVRTRMQRDAYRENFRHGRYRFERGCGILCHDGFNPWVAP